MLFGAEKDFDSISSAACRGAKRFGGLVIGITYGATIDGIVEKQADAIITACMGRGGGREFILVSSCDAIICLSGGSGTLTEIAIAYQANIPIIVLTGTGGWSERLSGTFLDERNRVRAEPAGDAKTAVDLALSQIKKSMTVINTTPDITVASVYATDRIYDQSGNWIRDQEGGPCLFIVDALKHQKISFNTLTPAEKH